MADVRAYLIAIGSVALALATTRFTWPLFARTPFVLLFGAIFVAARWGSEGAGLVAILLSALGATQVTPAADSTPFDRGALVIFIAAAFIANRIVAGRNRAEVALQASEAQLRAGWEQAAIGLALLNLRGQVERLNPAMERILDFPGPAWAGVSIGYFSHPDDAATERDRFNELMASSLESYQLEQRYRRRDGAYIWGRVTMSVIRGAEGKPSGALMMLEDVTSRRRAEEALRASEEELRGLFEGVPVGLFRSTAAGTILAANRAMLGMLGYESIDALRSLTLGDLFEDPAAQGALRSVLATHGDEIRSVETSLRRSDGRRLPVVMSARAVRDARGVVRYYEGSVLDLSDHVDLERQLLHAQKQDVMGRMVSGVVHNFNNLLTAIGGYTELALSQLGPDARGELEEVLKVSQRAAALTRQLVTFSRQDAVEPEVLDLNDVIEGVATLLKRLIGDVIELTFVLAPDLRPIKIDAGQLEHLLVNLAVNARDAMPGGGTLTFETANVAGTAHDNTAARESAGRPWVRLVVSDTGCGMDETVKAHLFEPFFTTKEAGRGSGLGLASVEGTVKRAGGHIRVQSAVGQGTTFTIDFPCAAMAEVPPGLRPATDGSPRRAATGTGTVLLVEDDESVRNLALTVLRQRGYHVLDARSGEEAVTVARAHPGRIDLVLADVVMPGIGGPALVDELRRARPDLKALFTSGSTKRAIERSAGLPADASFLEKPFTPDDLARAVRTALM